MAVLLVRKGAAAAGAGLAALPLQVKAHVLGACSILDYLAGSSLDYLALIAVGGFGCMRASQQQGRCCVYGFCLLDGMQPGASETYLAVQA